MAKRKKPLYKTPATPREYLSWYWVYATRMSTRLLLRRRIPNEDELFFRVHRSYLRDGEIIPGAFRDQGDHPILRGMSTDWNRYSTAEESRKRARSPEDNGIVSLEVARVRAISGLEVDHDPQWRNRAHSHVNGEKDAEARLKLTRASRWVISIPGE